MYPRILLTNLENKANRGKQGKPPVSQMHPLFVLRRLPILFWLLSGTLLAAIPPTPADGNFLHDLAGLLTSQEQYSLRTRQQQVFQEAQVAIVVVTVLDKNQYVQGTTSIEAFSKLWFNTWGIGSQQKNDGILALSAETTAGRGSNSAPIGDAVGTITPSGS